MKPVLGKADLHIHSEFGVDSFSSIRRILEMAEKRGLDIIAITDHDTIKGVEKAQRMSAGFNVQVIKGEEVSTKEGHLLALFIEEFIQPQKPILETISEIHRQGGLAIIPHPCNPFSHGVSLDVILKIYKEVDGIEIFNGSWTGWMNRKKTKIFNLEVSKLALTGGSDAHVPGHVGTAYTIFEGKNIIDLRASLKNKTTRADGFFDLLGCCELLINQPRRIVKKLSYRK